ncbi:MAG: hypothetical protein AB7G80_01620 [Dongiaceae bacterium]
MRWWLLVCLVGVAVVSAGLYHVKYRVMHLEENLSTLRREVASHQEAVHVLEAELAYLKRPNYIARLSAKHLALRPLKPYQIHDTASLHQGPQLAGLPVRAAFASSTVKVGSLD